MVLLLVLCWSKGPQDSICLWVWCLSPAPAAVLAVPTGALILVLCPFILCSAGASGGPAAAEAAAGEAGAAGAGGGEGGWQSSAKITALMELLQGLRSRCGAWAWVWYELLERDEGPGVYGLSVARGV